MCGIIYSKQKTANERRISDRSSDVCSSELGGRDRGLGAGGFRRYRRTLPDEPLDPPPAAGARSLGRGCRSSLPWPMGAGGAKIGSASCWARVLPFVSILAVSVLLKTTYPHIYLFSIRLFRSFFFLCI